MSDTHALARWVGCTALILLVSVPAAAQLPPGAQLVPPGYKLEGELNLGGSIIISAKKPNDTFPKPHMDQGITLEITWMNNPAADQILEIAAGQPEDPAGQVAGSATREEPCGNERYRGGVRRCRKVITPWIGSGRGPDLVTWRVAWTGKGQQGGLVGVSVNNYFGSKEAACALLDQVIPKIAQAK
jgi:hypothetical protein